MQGSAHGIQKPATDAADSSRVEDVQSECEHVYRHQGCLHCEGYDCLSIARQQQNHSGRCMLSKENSMKRRRKKGVKEAVLTPGPTISACNISLSFTLPSQIIVAP